MLLLATPAGAQTIVPVQPAIPVAAQPCGDYRYPPRTVARRAGDVPPVCASRQ